MKKKKPNGKEIARINIPIWYYYFGSKDVSNVKQITVTEMENKTYVVKNSNGVIAKMTNKKDAIGLFNQLVENIIR